MNILQLGWLGDALQADATRIAQLSKYMHTPHTSDMTINIKREGVGNTLPHMELLAGCPQKASCMPNHSDVETACMLQQRMSKGATQLGWHKVRLTLAQALARKVGSTDNITLRLT